MEQGPLSQAWWDWQDGVQTVHELSSILLTAACNERQRARRLPESGAGIDYAVTDLCPDSSAGKEA
eukprot:scaffold14781_cov48-Prasinocladus_malaysianus.AAC.2